MVIAIKKTKVFAGVALLTQPLLFIRNALAHFGEPFSVSTFCRRRQAIALLHPAEECDCLADDADLGKFFADKYKRLIARIFRL